MIEKIIHISDVHIRTLKRHDEYREILTNLLDDVKIQIKDYNPDNVRIVITGDIVHQKITVSNELFNMLSWFFKSCSDIATTIIIPGNHDFIEGNTNRIDSLSPIIDVIDRDNIKYLKKTDGYLDDNIVWMVYSLFDNNDRPDLEDNIAKYGKDKKYVGLFHGPVIGSKTPMGFSFEEGVVNLSYFEGLDFVLLGDIHLRQSFALGKTILTYASTPIQQDFGENVGLHGYLIWNVETGTSKGIDIPSQYGFYKIKIDNIDDLDGENGYHFENL